MGWLNRTPFAIILGKGTKTSLTSNDTYAENQGEIAMATNEDRVYIGDSNYRFKDLLNFLTPWEVVDEDFNVMVDEDKTISFTD